MPQTMQIVYVPPDRLLSNPDHAPVYGPTLPADDAMIALEERIRATGHMQPLVVSKGTPGVPDGTIVNGTRRAAAARLMQLDAVPVIFRAFSSGEEMKRAMVLDNEQREKDEWTKTAEFVTVLLSLKAEARLRQRDAARRTNTLRGAHGATEPPPVPCAVTTPVHHVAKTDAELPGDPAAGIASAATGVGADDDGGSGVRSDPNADRNAADQGPEDAALPAPPKEDPDRPATLRGARAGEAFKLAKRMFRQGTGTLECRLRLWDAARRLNAKEPGASPVAEALRAPGAKVEAVARDFGLISKPPTTGTVQTANPLADAMTVARAFRGHFGDAAVDPGDVDALINAVREAVEAGVAFLVAKADPSLRLVHACPRRGTNLSPLRNAKMKIVTEVLHAEIANAHAAGWSRTEIAEAAKVKNQKAFKAWCGDRDAPVRVSDLYRLARWIEASQGTEPSSKRPGKRRSREET